MTIDSEALATRAEGESRIPIAISSESPVSRWYGREILAHDKSAVDLSYARDGLPLLLDHDAGQQVGIVEDVKLRDGQLRGMMRFSASARAQEIQRDVLDGIRKNISVGYRVGRMELVSSDETEGDTYRASKWTPMEVSQVAVPADISVGVGRGASGPETTYPVEIIRATTQEGPMSEETKGAPAPAAAPVVSVAEVRNELQAQAKTIRELGRVHKIPGETVDGWLERGFTPDQVRTAILETQATQSAKAPIQSAGIELTEKERKAFSIARAIRTYAERLEGGRANSFEMELQDDLRKRALASGAKLQGGLLLPTSTRRQSIDEELITRAGLDSATSTKGAELKFTVPGDFLPLLRNKLALQAVGATFMGGLTGPFAFVNQNGAGTASWVAENPGSDVADSNLTLQQITLAPKTLMSTTSYSRQLLAQESYDAESAVRDDLANIMAIELDRAGIDGTGASNQPTGILATSGVDITSVVGGTNGAQPTFGNIVDLESVVCKANADQWPLSYLTTPQIRGRLKQTAPISNTYGLPVWTAMTSDEGAALYQGGGSRQGGWVNGYPSWASQNVPSNKTKGTSSGVCHVILFGAFSQLVIGDWGVFELVVDPYRLKKQAMIEVTSFGMFGVAVKYTGAFAAMVDALK